MNAQTEVESEEGYLTVRGSRSQSGYAPPTPLIGRKQELAELEARLADPNNRLLSLTGPGGVGKTRLAIALADQSAERYGDRVWFVSLATVTDAQMVPGAIAWALTGREPGGKTAFELITTAIGHEPALLLLDNFEQVISAAHSLPELLSALPNLQIVVTSRETLRLRSEQVIAVPPLSLPGEERGDAALAGVSDAMELFTECVQSIRPGFVPTDDDTVVIGEICRRLDGLPLAIELAAARCRALTPRALLARLSAPLQMLSHGPRDLPERQRTMRSTITWSYELLNEQDRVLFRRLSAFQGAFTLAAAEMVLGFQENDASESGIDPLMVLDGVSSLLEKNLLREKSGENGEQRFRMLQTIHEFAADELFSHKEDAAFRKRHANWCSVRALESWHRLYRNDFDSSLFSELEEEHDDFRSALTWLENRQEVGQLLQLAADLSPFWFFSSHRQEGLSWLARGVALFGATQIPEPLHAQVLHFIGLLTPAGDVSIRHLEESIAIWERLGDSWAVASSAIPLAFDLNALGRHAEALTFAEVAVNFYENVDDVWFGSASQELGLAYFGLGKLEEARRNFQNAISSGRTNGDWYGAGLASNALGLLLIETGELPSARLTLIDALDFWKSLRMSEGVAGSIGIVAMYASAIGDHRNAAFLLGAAHSISERVEHEPAVIEANRLIKIGVVCSQRLGTEADTLVRNGRSSSIHEAIFTARRALNVEVVPSSSASRREERPHGLTAREIEILRLLAQGMSDREIAEELFISRLTVSRHTANIFAKIDVNSRTAAAAFAFRHGFATT